MTIKTGDADRELLELAAKSAGIERGIDRLDCGVSTTEKDGRHRRLPRWNPLEDDGDALRLAVKLGITIYPPDKPGDDPTATWAHPDSEWIVEPHGNDPYAAMRRAIVRAAAEIGRNKS